MINYVEQFQFIRGVSAGDFRFVAVVKTRSHQHIKHWKFVHVNLHR